jgi:hypothetical protein
LTSEQALLKRYHRLLVIAERIVSEATAVGDPERPMAGIAPHLLRDLRREIEGEPQPSAFATMSVS